jgi:copper resistance protein B
MSKHPWKPWLAGTLGCLGLVALAQAAEPLPPVTPEPRAAAFPDVSGTNLHAHMEHDPLTAMLLAKQFEWQAGSGDDAVQWDATGWAGYSMNRVWLRSEGERPSHSSGTVQTELLYGRPVAPWWDLVAGVRHDIGPGPARSYAAIGVQGLAPQWFHVEATAYYGERGQAGLRLQADYEWLFTNRLILTSRTEARAWSEDDERTGIGSGLSETSLGLRLRYEIRPEFAPYVGYEWYGRFGDTADIARAAGEDRRQTRVVAGLRFWF